MYLFRVMLSKQQGKARDGFSFLSIGTPKGYRYTDKWKMQTVEDTYLTNHVVPVSQKSSLHIQLGLVDTVT